MGREEQIEEREVLESIFPEEITYLSDTEFRIDVKLDIPNDDDDDAAAEPPGFILSVRYPENYPDEAPHLDILAPLNAAAAGSHEHFSLADDRDRLLSGLADTVQENLGMAMVFTLVSALKDAAELLVQERRDARLREAEERRLEAEREENKKFHGTPVNPETFAAWRRAFLAEMDELRAREEEELRLAELKKTKAREPVRLTGKQLWQQGLMGKIDEAEDDEDGVPTEGVQQLKVDA